MALDQLDTSRVDQNFLAYALRFRGLDDAISGTAQPQITRTSLESVRIPLPPLPEQRRIAAILDQADAIRRKRQKAIELTEKFLKSAFLEMFGDPVTNPKGWTECRIRDLVETANYGTSGKAGSVGRYAVLRMNNITYSGDWDFSDLKYIDLDEKEEPKYLVRKGDLLFNRTNSKELVGKSAVYPLEDPMAFAGYLVRVRTSDQAHPEYISGYLNSEHGKATLRHMCKSIVGMANINAQELQDIRILNPPIQLQKRFADVVSVVRKNQSRLKGNLAQIENLFNSLVQRAFRGELSPVEVP